MRLFQHYWVIFFLTLTVLATVVLLLHLPSVSILADTARTLSGLANLQTLGGDCSTPP